MGIRAAATGRLILEEVQLPASALLGGGQAEVYAECIALGRLGWCALAVGTGQAALDYVIDYVKERRRVRRADLQPPGRGLHGRQHGDRARRACAWPRTAPPAASTRAWTFAREVALARRLCADRGMQHRLRRRADARRPRLRQGASRRALVSRPARGRPDGGGAGRLMINLEIPKKFSTLVAQSHQVATEVFRAQLAQVRHRRARVPQGARHAGGGDRRHERVAARSAARAPAPSAAASNGSAPAGRRREPQRLATWRACSG